MADPVWVNEKREQVVERSGADKVMNDKASQIIVIFRGIERVVRPVVAAAQRSDERGVNFAPIAPQREGKVSLDVVKRNVGSARFRRSRDER